MSKSQDRSDSAGRSAVSEPIQQLVALFGEHLRDVAFPGVDAARLDTLATEVQARAETLASAEADLIAAREAHAAAHAELGRTAAAALGYARVYATDDARLSAALADIELTPTVTQRTTRTKRKPRSTRTRDDGVTKLPFQGEPRTATG